MRIYLFLIFLISHEIFAQNLKCSKNGTSMYYINGVNVSDYEFKNGNPSDECVKTSVC